MQTDPCFDSFRLSDEFDAVVMLTWSDWKTEPRSNRYHYATRFGRHVPVLFVQPDRADWSVESEVVPDTNIEIVHIPCFYGGQQTLLLASELHKRGIFRPLFWCYNCFFEHFFATQPARLKIYHATEDYFTPPEGWAVGQEVIQGPLRRVLRETDLVVAVSEGVADSYRKRGGYEGRLSVLKNGCDYCAWVGSGASEHTPGPGGQQSTLFQGGINARLDYALLIEVAERLPDWELWFCGRSSDGGEGWERLLAHPNVRYFGQLDPAGIADLARKATVGLIPFKQDELIRRSLPLKAYEYTACGLPVVTVPIDELKENPDLFREALTGQEFAEAILELAPTRRDPDLVARRLAVSALNSYDNRFGKLLIDIKGVLNDHSSQEKLNILVLYDDGSTFVETINEHLQSFQKYSRHNVYYMPGTGERFSPLCKEVTSLDFDLFDAIVIHYSIRVSVSHHVAPSLIDSIAKAKCLKILLIQDEYDTTNLAMDWIERLGINTVFTNVPLTAVGLVYPRSRFPNLDFVSTLTGYVPEVSDIENFITPLADRKTLIGYRGRRLPHQYGDLGYEKAEIGIHMKRLALEKNLQVDIETDDEHRIYGTDWYRFMGSCRATLGTESGCTIFDFDGSLGRLARDHAAMPYPKFRAQFLEGLEGMVPMNQVSPKIFEAIRLRTALILFEGSYSDVVRPESHYIPLKKDFSNIEDVFAKLLDETYIKIMTERAYNDVIRSGKYSYRSFISSFDRYLASKLPATKRAQFVRVPVLVRPLNNAAPLREPQLCLAASDIILGRTLKRDDYEQLLQHALMPRSASEVVGRRSSALRRIWRIIPRKVRHGLVRFVHTAAMPRYSASPAHVRAAQKLFKLLPAGLRNLIRSHVGW